VGKVVVKLFCFPAQFLAAAWYFLVQFGRPLEKDPIPNEVRRNISASEDQKEGARLQSWIQSTYYNRHENCGWQTTKPNSDTKRAYVSFAAVLPYGGRCLSLRSQ
jgi:hypothetical protein